MNQNKKINHINDLPNDIISTCIMSFLTPGERINNAFVSKFFHENALSNGQASSYWLFMGASSFNNFKKRTMELKNIHLHLSRELLFGNNLSAHKKLEAIESIGESFKQIKSEQILDYALGKGPTLLF